MPVKYTVPYSPETKNIISTFLLKKSDTVRFTQLTWRGLFGFIGFLGIRIGKEYGTQTDPKFLRVLESLAPNFIKKITTNTRCDDIAHEKLFTHYFYTLSKRMRKLLSREPLNFWAMTSEPFYGFEDPVFYSKEKLIGLVSHEARCVLFLLPIEKKLLERKGLFLTPVA